MFFLIFLMFIILIVIIVIACTAYIVPQQKAFVIERLGKFNKITSPGFHIKIPIIDVIHAKIDLRMSQSDFSINAKTKDNVTVKMLVAIQYRVDSRTVDSLYKSCYMLVSPVEQMNSYIADALRASVPSWTLDELFERKSEIAEEVNKIVGIKMKEYGYEIASTLITDIDMPPDVKESMNNINSARRNQEAAIALAEAERVKVVTEAKAKAEAAEQAGIGIAKQRKAIADGISQSIDTIKKCGVSEEDANMLFLYTQWIDMMCNFADAGKTSTVILPSNFKENVSMFEQLIAADKAKEKVSLDD